MLQYFIPPLITLIAIFMKYHNFTFKHGERVPVAICCKILFYCTRNDNTLTCIKLSSTQCNVKGQNLKKKSFWYARKWMQYMDIDIIMYKMVLKKQNKQQQKLYVHSIRCKWLTSRASSDQQCNTVVACISTWVYQKIYNVIRY